MREGEADGCEYYFRDEKYFENEKFATTLFVNEQFWKPGMPKWLYGVPEFEIKDNKWYIMHTVVLPEYGGRGIAKRLVLTLINEARKRNIKIVPICSYAVKMMIGNEEFKDIM